MLCINDYHFTKALRLWSTCITTCEARVLINTHVNRLWVNAIEGQLEPITDYTVQ